MPEATLERDLALERSLAVRTLLGHPLVDAAADPDGFRNVVRHRVWLVDWFESSCGWPLTVDVGAGFARLVKRRPDPDPRRPFVRTRGAGGPFDRRRYQLLCRVATTVGIQ